MLITTKCVFLTHEVFEDFQAHRTACDMVSETSRCVLSVPGTLSGTFRLVKGKRAIEV